MARMTVETIEFSSLSSKVSSKNEGIQLVTPSRSIPCSIMPGMIIEMAPNM